MDEKEIARINELAAIKKQRPLTQEEAEERALLHKRYVEEVRSNLSAHMENIVIQRPDGTREKVRKKDEKPQ